MNISVCKYNETRPIIDGFKNNNINNLESEKNTELFHIRFICTLKTLPVLE